MDFQGWEDDLDQSIKDKIAAGTIEVIQDRWVSVKQLKWCKMTAIEILDESDCDGQYIPIIECNGTLININGKLSKKGIIRDAKGPQRMLNYYSTLEAENVALQPKAPWIMEEGQIEGHEDKLEVSEPQVILLSALQRHQHRWQASTTTTTTVIPRTTRCDTSRKARQYRSHESCHRHSL